MAAERVTITDIAKAKAFALWAKSTIGIEPKIVNVNEQYLEIDFTQPEVKAWEKYFDKVLFSALRPDPNAEVSTVQIRFGKILVPWATRYLVAIVIAGIVIGRLTK